MVKTSFLNFLKTFLFLDRLDSVKKGTSVALKVPSARSLLNKFGILKATQNASVSIFAPKKKVISKSLIQPNILLMNVKKPTLIDEEKKLFIILLPLPKG